MCLPIIVGLQVQVAEMFGDTPVLATFVQPLIRLLLMRNEILPGKLREIVSVVTIPLAGVLESVNPVSRAIIPGVKVMGLEAVPDPNALTARNLMV